MNDSINATIFDRAREINAAFQALGFDVSVIAVSDTEYVVLGSERETKRAVEFWPDVEETRCEVSRFVKLVNHVGDGHE